MSWKELEFDVHPLQKKVREVNLDKRERNRRTGKAESGVDKPFSELDMATRNGEIGNHLAKRNHDSVTL